MRSLLREVGAFALAASLLAGPASAANTAADDASASPPVTLAAAAEESSTGILAGVITNASRNTPVGGAAISVQGAGTSRSTTSRGDGSFTFTLPAGVYDITVSKGGFQTSTVAGFGVVAGTSSNITISIPEANSSTLRTIGRVSVSRRGALNTSTTSIATLGGDVIQQRQLPNLSDTVTELPGVTLARTTGATANAFFIVRGGDVETRVNINGHPVSVGTFGNYNTNYAIASVFDQVEVVKGAGLNGPTAGESAFGTVNLRTRDFTARNYFDIKLGSDSFAGSTYDVFASVNLLKDNRLSLVAGRAFSGYLGPYDRYTANRVGSNTFTPPAQHAIPTINGLVQWQGDLSNRYNLAGELAKLRYRFSNATSLSVEYLGLQGQYYPQGGAYASYEGQTTIAPCFNGGTPAADASGCSLTSVYNPPYARGLIGSTVPTYFWFPNSYIQNNEPQFSAELKTSIKNDTVLLRPYTALINRFISGDRENLYPGNAGGWFKVTSGANCQAAFVSPTASAGAKGPCFGTDFGGPTGPAYVGTSNDPRFPILYPTTPNAPTCTVASPCWTTPTGYQNDGKIGFGSPFSQPEIDRLHGVTFQYLHPVHENLYGFSYDYNSDDTFSNSADTTGAMPGCTFVVGGGVKNANGSVQPSCLLGTAAAPGSSLPVTSLAIPPTIIRKNDYALTGLLQLTPSLQAALGLYYTKYQARAQTEDPAVLAAAAAAFGNSGAAPVALVQRTNSFSHLDPHLGFTYRANPNLTLRATAGSSITTPYASIISGLGRIELPNGSNNQTYTLTLANSGLLPETTVAYNLGFDQRLPDGGIFTFDVFNNTVHNIFASVTTPLAVCPVATANCFQSTNINGPIGRYYGLEAGVTRSVPLGFGYTLTGTLQRAYLDQLPLSIYARPATATASLNPINLINGKQLDGSVNGQGSVPFAKAYGEIRYTGLRNSLFSLGADYEGSNNSTYGPAYVIFNGTARVQVIPEVNLQMSVENISNFSTGTLLGRALFNQGNQTLTQAQAFDGTLVPGAPRNKSLQEVNPRTIRLTLQHRF